MTTTLGPATIPRIQDRTLCREISNNLRTLRRRQRVLKRKNTVLAFSLKEQQSKPDTGTPKQNSDTEEIAANLRNVLLRNAASLLSSNRAEAFCRTCKGTGKVICPACKGAGIVEPEKVRMNSIKHAWHKLSTLFESGEKSVSMYDSDWFKSNRCKRCLGRGAIVCTSCNGSGRRA